MNRHKPVADLKESSESHLLPEQVRQEIFPSVGLTSDLKCGGSSTLTKLSKACGGKMSNYYILFSRRWLPLSCYPRTLICQHLPCFQPHDPQGMEHHSGDEVALVVNQSSCPNYVAQNQS